MAQPPITDAGMKGSRMKDGKMHKPPVANGAMHDGAAKPMPMAKPAN